MHDDHAIMIPTQEQRTWAMLIHLLPGVLVFATPVPGVFVALILWMVKRDTSGFLDDHGREATNFWVSVLLYSIVVFPLAALLTCGVGALLYIPLLILVIVGVIQASLAAKRGEFYRYPATIRLF